MAAYYPNCPQQCETICTCVKVCCPCGKRFKQKVEVKVPPKTVRVSASLSSNQAYTTTATTILFNSVTCNVTCFNPCGTCHKDPCCCKKKHHKRHCDSSSSSSSSCSSSSGCRDKCRGKCGSCVPRYCPPYGYPGNCPPYGYPSGYPGNCPPFGFPYYCLPYNPQNGVVTIPPGGTGSYVVHTSVEVDSVNTSTVEIRMNGTAIATAQVGGVVGVQTVTLTAFPGLCTGNQITVVVYDDTGAANVVGGANTKLEVARLA